MLDGLGLVQRQLDSASVEVCTEVSGTFHCSRWTYAIESIEPLDNGNHLLTLSCDVDFATQGNGVGDFEVRVEVRVDGVLQADYVTGECGFQAFDGEVEISPRPGDIVDVDISWTAFGGDGVSLSAQVPFDAADSVSLVACEPTLEHIVLDGDDPATFPAWNTWRNDIGTYVVFDATVLIGGAPASITVTNENQSLVQTGESTYRIQVGPDGAQNTANFDVDVASLPVGDNVYEVETTTPIPTDGSPIA